MTPEMLTRASIARYQAAVGQKYRHLSTSDIIVWAAAQMLGLFPGDRFDYDVQLGGYGPVPDDEVDSYTVNWSELIKKRVDVAVWRGDQPFIIEVKPVAHMSALGQLLGYQFLWKEERAQERVPALVVLCIQSDFDCLRLWPAFGVLLVELPLQVRPVIWEAIATARSGRTSLPCS